MKSEIVSTPQISENLDEQCKIILYFFGFILNGMVVKHENMLWSTIGGNTIHCDWKTKSEEFNTLWPIIPMKGVTFLFE